MGRPSAKDGAEGRPMSAVAAAPEGTDDVRRKDGRLPVVIREEAPSPNRPGLTAEKGRVLLVRCLDKVEWGALTHAYGSAADVPDRLRALVSADPLARKRAYEELDAAVCHQGSRYEASAHVAAFLVQLVADPEAPDRRAALEFLAALAIGYDRWWLPGSYPVAEIRREVARKATLTVEELQRELEEWVEAAPTESLRRSRAIDAKLQDVVENRDGQRWGLEAYDAVRHGVAVYCDALGSPDRDVRLWAAYLLGWFPEEHSVGLASLVRRLQIETDPSVAATIAIATGLIVQAGETSAWSALMRRLRARHQVERWAGAIALARLTPSADATVVKELYACVRHVESLLAHQVPYLEGDLASLAALTLAELTGDAAPERLDVLAGRLSDWPATRPADSIVHSLLKIAFPDGPVPDQTPFANLTGDQRRVVLALAEAPNAWTYEDVRELVSDHGLPNGYEALRRYAQDLDSPP